MDHSARKDRNILKGRKAIHCRRKTTILNRLGRLRFRKALNSLGPLFKFLTRTRLCQTAIL
jgi:hypothetical protein